MGKTKFRIVSSTFLVCAIWYTIYRPLVPGKGPGGAINLRSDHREGGLTRNEYIKAKSFIDTEISKSSSTRVPEFLEVYYQYDMSGKTALLDLLSYLYTNQIQLPLFEDRLASPTVNKPGPKICVSVVSARRPRSQFTYLLQTISGLLNRMNYKKYKDLVYIHVFNVDNQPSEHKETDITRPLLPTTDLKVPIETEADFPVQTHYHENRDKAEIIRKMSGIGCEYPIVLADDALATNDWVDSVLLAIKQIESQSKGIEWFMVRLFTARSVYPFQKTAGLNDYDQEFGAVALLINPRYTEAFAEELDNVVKRTIKAKNHALHVPTDHMAERFSRDHGLKVWSFEPVIFQHTGAYSCVTNRPVNAGTVGQWFMSSKRFDADKQPIKFNRAFWP